MAGSSPPETIALNLTGEQMSDSNGQVADVMGMEAPQPQKTTETLPEIERLRPCGKRLLVKPLPPPDRTKGGILIPDAENKPTTFTVGRVLAAGEGCSSSIRYVNTLVMFSNFAITHVPVNGVKCGLIREDDILGIVNG